MRQVLLFQKHPDNQIMANGKIKITSYNVNGLLNPIKRNKILTKMKKEQAQIVYLQETQMDFKEPGWILRNMRN